MTFALQDAAQPQPFWSSFTGLAWVDQVGVFIIGVFVLLGIWRGMWWQIVRFLGVMMSIALARSLAPRLQPTLSNVTGGTDAVTHGVAWFSIFLAGLVVATLFGMLGKKTLEALQLGLIDRLGGAVVGALTGVVIHGALLILTCSLTSPKWIKSHVKGTRSHQILAQVNQYHIGPLHAEAKETIFHWGAQFHEHDE